MSANAADKAISFEQIYTTHALLFPSEFEFLVLYNLHVNYPSSEVRYAEIKQAIVDTSSFPPGEDPSAEKLTSLVVAFAKGIWFCGESNACLQGQRHEA